VSPANANVTHLPSDKVQGRAMPAPSDGGGASARRASRDTFSAPVAITAA